MKIQDQHNIASLYEEGVWDRAKAGASGIAGGLGGLKVFGGKGYAKSAQEAKGKSLLKSFATKMLNEIQKFEDDSSEYNEPQVSPSLLKKTGDMRNLLNNYIS